MMNERDDIPPLPEPWPAGQAEEQPNAAPTPPSLPSKPGGGCGKPIVFGCGCLSIGAVLLLIFMVAMSGRIVNWFLDTTEETILAALPEEVTETERERLETSFDRFRRGVTDGSLNTRGLTQLQVELTNAYSRAQRGLLERVDIERLLAAFEGVLGDAPEPAEPPTSPAEIPIAALPLESLPSTWWLRAATPVSPGPA